MPPRSTVDLLPPSVRDELDGRIVNSAFGDYEGHAAWLRDQGHEVSPSALQRYGRRRRKDLDAETSRTKTMVAERIAKIRAAQETAKAINAAHGDDDLALPQATANAILARIQEAMANDDQDPAALKAAAQTLNETMKTLAALRGQRQADLENAAKRAGKVAQDRGLPNDVADALRKAIRTVPDQG